MSDLLNNWEVELAGIGLVGGSLKDIWLLLLASCFETFLCLLSNCLSVRTDAREILRFAEGQESWCLIGNMMPPSSVESWKCFCFAALERASPPHRQSGMLATLKGNVGERFFGPNLLPSPALLCTTFYRCSDIQLVDGEILAEIARKLNLLNICVNIS